MTSRQVLAHEIGRIMRTYFPGLLTVRDLLDITAAEAFNLRAGDPGNFTAYQLHTFMTILHCSGECPLSTEGANDYGETSEGGEAEAGLDLESPGAAGRSALEDRGGVGSDADPLADAGAEGE